MKTVTDFAAIRARDMVTYRDRFGALRRGPAQPLLCNPSAGTVVLNMGGRYGTPVVVTPETFVSVTRKEG